MIAEELLILNTAKVGENSFNHENTYSLYDTKHQRVMKTLLLSVIFTFIVLSLLFPNEFWENIICACIGSLAGYFVDKEFLNR